MFGKGAGADGGPGREIAAADRIRCEPVFLPRLYHGYTRALTEIVKRRFGPLMPGACGSPQRSDCRLPSVSDPKEAVGGALIDLGCHPVYLTQLFLGERPETRAPATGLRPVAH
jgi:predicted dehydrogenase